MGLVRLILAVASKLFFPLQPANPTEADRQLTRYGYTALLLFAIVWIANRLYLLPEAYVDYATGVSIVCICGYLICFTLAGMRMAAEDSAVRSRSFGVQVAYVFKKISLYMFLPAIIISAAFIAVLYFLHRLP